MGWGLFSWHRGQLAFVTIEKPNIGIMNWLQNDLS